MNKELLKKIPKVDDLLRRSELEIYIVKFGREMVKETIQDGITKLRQEVLLNKITIDITENGVIDYACSTLDRKEKSGLKRVINATGVVLHTNLGRARISESAQEKLLEVAFGYSNLEYDLTTGKRGSRYQVIEKDLISLSHSEAGFVVNNNAAAVLLALSTIAKGKEIIISRGELVEIGGSFRIPEIIELSGGIIKEVGTTNKTKIEDYAKAINENTGAILKVHTSNYKVVGFTESVAIDQLASLAREHDLPLVNDLGSGLFYSLEDLGLPPEPTVSQAIESGCDIVTFSGDKLLGGPQSGLIVGKKVLIEKMKKNQLTRTLRIDKLSLAVLEQTLKAYLQPDHGHETIPIIRALKQGVTELEIRGNKLSDQLKGNNALSVNLLEDCSQVGGGSFPEVTLPTICVTVSSMNISCHDFSEQLRQCDIPVVCRIKDNQLVFDMRTVQDDELVDLGLAIKKVLKIIK
ncbi:L-seryl-tRNA(Sec) selenium transferase [Vagococcus coleopterorum]|uniref:L-seryl-tRNA(Sec) selenium transferase n=1 Tax=Vagococcus coleopterorum TaxID=2714946 RepID=A0A6G8ANW8_9ENTE|nr:L-seryl-tRNA(Sec) selenium transferase [Vagococcus coleopterorum]QIL46696.1 L-seryl-tRNA(Sec) selenium transferase [Vagococcus coleopterorum]